MWIAKWKRPNVIGGTEETSMPMTREQAMELAEEKRMAGLMAWTEATMYVEPPEGEVETEALMRKLGENIAEINGLKADRFFLLDVVKALLIAHEEPFSTQWLAIQNKSWSNARAAIEKFDPGWHDRIVKEIAEKSSGTI